MKKIAVLVLLLAAVWGGLQWVPEQGRQQPSFLDDGEFEIIAHGAAQGLGPNNTVEAAREARSQVADAVIEIDVHPTADGRLVLSHDDTVDRLTNGSGRIDEMSLAQVQQFDAGFHFVDAQGKHSFRGQGVKIPLLSEMFEAFPDSRYLIEIKQTEPDIVAPLCKLITDYGLADKTIVGTFHQETIDKFRAHCPQVATSASKKEITWFLVMQRLGLAHLMSLPAVGFQVPINSGGITVVTPGFVKAAHAKGVKVQVWTINDEAEMQALIDMGVDGLITDFPARVEKVMGAQK